MSQSPPAYQSQLSRPDKIPAPESNGAMITVPTPRFAFEKEPWGPRASDYWPPRVHSKSVSLPSIRQAIPELHLATGPERQGRRHSYHHPRSYAPPAFTGFLEHIYSPTSKRRRISNEEDGKSLRSHQVARLYPSPDRTASSSISPVSQRPSIADDSWTSQVPVHYKKSSPASPEAVHREPHPSLHSLSPPPGLKRGRDGHYADEHVAYRRMENYPSGHSSRSQLLRDRNYEDSGKYHFMPAVPTRPEDRSPFAPSRCGISPHNAGRNGDIGIPARDRDTKQRQRCVRFPKEVSDRLHHWLLTHQRNPYPTEDEKQDIMCQTGLKRRQLSRWLMNARRRKLPTMISNAHGETDAMLSRATVDTRLPRQHRSFRDRCNIVCVDFAKYPEIRNVGCTTC